MVALPVRTVVRGNPVSASHEIDPVELVQLLEAIEAQAIVNGQTLYYEETLAQLQAITGAPANSTGFVLSDPVIDNIGTYRWIGGGTGWAKTAGLPALADSYAELAERWANEDEDTVVLGGEFSAKHYAAKAAAEVDLAAGQVALAAQQVELAEDQVGLASAQVTLAEAEVALATAQADAAMASAGNASGSETSAAASAAAAALDRTAINLLANTLPADYIVSTFADLPGSPTNGEVAFIKADETAGGLTTLRTYDGADWDDVTYLDPTFASVAELEAAPGTFAEGELLYVSGDDGPHTYEVVSADPHITTAGGAMLQLLRGPRGYNVKGLGVKGDGVTDDLAAINAAALAVLDLYFPPGVYLISGAIILVTGCRMFGDGNGLATVRLADGSNGNMVRIPADQTDLIIQGMRFDGNGANQTAGNIITTGNNTSNVEIIHNQFADSYNDSILLDKVTGYLVAYNLIERSGNHSIALSGDGNQATLDGKRIRVIGNEVRNPTSAGINCSEQQGINVTANNIYHSGGHVGGYAGIRVTNNSHTVSITGNVVEGMQRGITVNDAQSVAVSANTVHNTELQGILVAGDSGASPSQFCTVVGNAVLNPGLTGLTNDTNGIHLIGAQHCIVSNNTIRDRNNNMERGIREEDGDGNARDNRFWGNEIDGATIQDRNIVSDNTIEEAAILELRSYTVATLPSAASASQIIYVTDEVGGPTAAVSNGVNWLRTSDNAIVS